MHEDENDSSQCNMQTSVARCSRFCLRLKSATTTENVNHTLLLTVRPPELTDIMFVQPNWQICAFYQQNIRNLKGRRVILKGKKEIVFVLLIF